MKKPGRKRRQTRPNKNAGKKEQIKKQLSKEEPERKNCKKELKKKLKERTVKKEGGAGTFPGAAFLSPPEGPPRLPQAFRAYFRIGMQVRR